MRSAFVLLLAFGVAASTAAGQRASTPTHELRAALPTVLDEDEDRARALAAVQDLGGDASAAAAETLIDAYLALERAVEPELERRDKILRGGGSSARLARTRFRLQRARDVQDAVLEALRAATSSTAVDAMVGRLVHSSENVPLTLRLCLADRASLQAGAALRWVTSESPAQPKIDDLVVLLRAMAALGPRAEGAGALAVQLLQHRNLDVRAQAITALQQLAWAGAIVPLIDRIDAETGAMRQRVLDALVVLTAQHPGDAAGSWRAWLAAEGGPYAAGTVPLGRGDASVAKRARTGAGTVAGTYFGIAQDGESILYVVDRSQSMGGKAPGRGTAAPAGESGEAGDGARAPDTRWRYCLLELRQALQRLLPQQRFNVVAFANRVLTLADRMQPATPQNTAQALEWLEQLGLEFETNTYDALDLAFALAGRGVRDRYYPSEVDTIFFLSDGQPTRPAENGKLPRGGGGGDDPLQILSAVRRWNALGRVRVHAIGIGLRGSGGRARNGGGSGARRFLSELAGQNGGQFVDRR